MTILGLEFESYLLESTDFNDVPGVYVITTSEKWIDVGETNKLSSRLGSHERRPCWSRNAEALKLWVNFRRIENEQDRLTLEAKIRLEFNFTCGEK